MTCHELKCWPVFFQAIKRGDKTYEIRKNDRNFHVGDELYLREWDPQTQEYSGDALSCSVTYLTKGPEWGIPSGICILGLHRSASLTEQDGVRLLLHARDFCWLQFADTPIDLLSKNNNDNNQRDFLYAYNTFRALLGPLDGLFGSLEHLTYLLSLEVLKYELRTLRNT